MYYPLLSGGQLIIGGNVTPNTVSQTESLCGPQHLSLWPSAGSEFALRWGTPSFLNPVLFNAESNCQGCRGHRAHKVPRELSPKENLNISKPAYFSPPTPLLACPSHLDLDYCPCPTSVYSPHSSLKGSLLFTIELKNHLT